MSTDRIWASAEYMARWHSVLGTKTKRMHGAANMVSGCRRTKWVETVDSRRRIERGVPGKAGDVGSWLRCPKAAVTMSSVDTAWQRGTDADIVREIDFRD